MKSLRNLVCTVLMTMTMAVAMDDEASGLDRDGDGSVVRGVTDTSTEVPIERATDGEESTRRRCGRPGCSGCSGLSFAEFLANGMNGGARNGQTNRIGEHEVLMSALLNALLLPASTISGGSVDVGAAEEGDFEERDAERASFLEALRSGRVVFVSFTPQTTVPVAPAEATGSQQPSADDIEQ
jgi:hypothetical protein